MVQSINSPLCDPLPLIDPRLKILLNVTISRDGNYAFSKFSTTSGDYFTVSPKTHITMRYTPKDVPWEKHHQIIITQRNIFQLRTGLKAFYRNFQREGLYKYDDRGYITELLQNNNDTVIVSLTMGQLLRLSPSIVTDRRGIIYPGVQLTMNKEENKIDLSIDEFECLYDIFTTININQSGLTLLQTYIGMRKVSVEDTIEKVAERKPPKTDTNRNNGGSLFASKDEEYMKAPPKVNRPTSLDDLP